MTNSIDRFFRLSVAIFVGLIAAPQAIAHDPRAVVTGSTTVTFGFSDGTPMAFASARIFGPKESIPFLETTTDRLGRISFLPDRNGTWRADADDGHDHHLSVTASIRDGAPVGSGRGVPDGVVAFSIVLNLILGSLALGRWRRKEIPAQSPK